MIDSRSIFRLDFNFLGTALVLAGVGIVIIYSATWFAGSTPFHQKQMTWVAISIVLMLVFIMIDYHLLLDISPVLYGIGMLLLIYLLVWGKATANVKSWIILPGGFQFQPSEFMKIFTALALAKFFDSRPRSYLDFKTLAGCALIIGTPALIIAAQPDAGTAATYAPLVGAAMFFGGIKPRYWVIALVLFAIAAPITWATLKPYQKERIVVFLNPERDPLGSGYQVTQAKIAIGSGGLTGKGFKQSTQARYGYVPASHTDFIFSVLAEEFGFIGVVVVLGLYLFLIVQALTIAKSSRDRGGSFLVICLISFFIFHIFINVAMQIGLLPTTGIPLPLISYGGSSTMMFFMAIGLILNVDFRKYVNV